MVSGSPPFVRWSIAWQFGQTGRIEWVTDLAEIPSKYGVTNVYGDLGQIFANSTVAEPRLAAALLGVLIVLSESSVIAPFIYTLF